MNEINYGNDVRREWFERVFWSEHDRSHSAFQAFVNCYSAFETNEPSALRDWFTFRSGWNAGWSAGSDSGLKAAMKASR